MADDQYAGRERKFNQDLPATVGQFMLAVSNADGVARMQAVEITDQILKLPNITLEQKIGILNHDDPLVYAASLPAVTIAEARPLLAEEVDLDMSMTVHAATAITKDVDSQIDASGTGSFRAGLFKFSTTMKASVATHSSKKRESDYTATTDMRLKMRRHPLPEGLAKVLDAMNEVAKAANEVNVALAKREVDRMIEEDNPQLPKASELPAAEGEGE